MTRIAQQIVNLQGANRREQFSKTDKRGLIFRKAVKVILGLSAAGSIGYGSYEFIQTKNDPKKAPVSTRTYTQKTERSFFQALIDADNEVLKNHHYPVGPSSHFLLSFKTSNAALPVSSGNGPLIRPNLRSFFAMDTPVASSNKDAIWKMAFLSRAVDETLTAKNLRAAPQSQTPPPQIDTRAVPAPPPDTAARAQNSPPAPRGFAEPKHLSAPNFKVVHADSSRVTTAPDPDDIAFGNAIVHAAEKDVQLVAGAQTVALEFSKRYPQSAEAARLHNRVSLAASKHANALSERTALRADTLLAPVLFTEVTRNAIAACLAEIPALDRVSAVNRPVTIDPAKLAFILIAQINPAGRDPGETRAAFLEAAHARMLALTGPCLAPLFARGTVSLAVTDGDDDDLTRIRIYETEGSTIYRRPELRELIDGKGDPQAADGAATGSFAHAQRPPE